MPSGVFIKPVDAPNTLFHVTVHGVGSERIFRCRQDMLEFLSRYRNYLDPNPQQNSSRHCYANLRDRVSLLAYCLLDNHFHLVVHQRTSDGMVALMRRTQPAYVRYFNDRYRRRGPLFDARYAATPIRDADHARNCLAYVHLNHTIEQLGYEFSSHPVYTGRERADWIDARAGLRIFGGHGGYRTYINRVGPRMIDRKLELRGLCRDTHRYRPIA